MSEAQKEITFKSDIDVTLIRMMGCDADMVSAARVCTTGQECLNTAQDGDEKLFGTINYLMKHRHGTPFEHAAMTFYVHAPIFVWREWHRHRIGFSYNEESGRYKQLDPVFYLPKEDRPMFKVDGWKPGRPKFMTPTEFDCSRQIYSRGDSGDDRLEKLKNNLRRAYRWAYDMYEDNLAMDFDPGLARDCLPVGIFSGCWVTCNPRSLMAFLSLRTCEPDKATFVSYPLYEIEVAARKVEAIFAEKFPLTYKAFCDNGRVGP